MILKQNERRREHSLKNSTVSFNRRLSATEKLKIIKHTEERSIHATSNYYEVSWPTINTTLKKRKNLFRLLKVELLYTKVN